LLHCVKNFPHIQDFEKKEIWLILIREFLKFYEINFLKYGNIGSKVANET